MSVLKDERNLILGNGDVFFGATVGDLPSIGAYKTARSNGTLPQLAGNQGAVKGTVSIQIVRESVVFEIGTPLEVAAQAVIREGLHFKCALAELSLGAVAQLIGGGVFTQTSAGATRVPGHPIPLSLAVSVGYPLRYGPVIYTDSTPAAAAGPILTLSDGTVTGAHIPAVAAATGTGTLVISGAGDKITAAGVTVTVGGTAAGGQVYSIVFAGLYTVSYTAGGGDTNNNIATALAAALRGVAASGRVVNKFVAAAITAPAPGAAVITVTQVAYLEGYDYLNDLVNDTIELTGEGSATTGNFLYDYYYDEIGSETLTVGGQSALNQIALEFFHPYDDGRVLQLLVYKANPTGSLTMPFEETNFTHTEIEFRAVADFSKAVGNYLFAMTREVPQ